MCHSDANQNAAFTFQPFMKSLWQWLLHFLAFHFYQEMLYLPEYIYQYSSSEGLSRSKGRHQISRQLKVLQNSLSLNCRLFGEISSISGSQFRFLKIQKFTTRKVLEFLTLQHFIGILMGDNSFYKANGLQFIINRFELIQWIISLEPSNSTPYAHKCDHFMSFLFGVWRIKFTFFDQLIIAIMQQIAASSIEILVLFAYNSSTLQNPTSSSKNHMCYIPLVGKYFHSEYMTTTTKAYEPHRSSEARNKKTRK